MQAAEEPVLGHDAGRALGGEIRNSLAAGLEGALPREFEFGEADLPWWERPPFSGSRDTVSSSFARVLSEMTAPQVAEPAETFEATPPEWGGANLAREAADAEMREAMDEADALSYEGALRRGARVCAVSPVQMPQAGAHPAPAQALAQPDFLPAMDADAGKRLASVTIRLSRAECAQLRERAGKAGFTLSAYVRSCIFEAETLRAQVKQAINELRGECRGELRGESRASSPGALRLEPRLAAAEKKPPAPAVLPIPMPGAGARRHWWQLRSPGRNFAAQA